jgi:hypothetical protein
MWMDSRSCDGIRRNAIRECHVEAIDVDAIFALIPWNYLDSTKRRLDDRGESVG